ncbi:MULTISPECIES: rhomboid family intramembrane serine protease [Bacillaceae]|uniref:Rhomboid family intramembrane serine protease n=1 Tax=Evansella alkalicola TaxID=745819 RepID=A0ABS6K034_9BACI|nr:MULTISPECIES: rhomboid family intramembrane serine protease [Bacillaceae]MBU9724213.1 rhomboid family intramembrane serine protease [Bacillus alkalicola]
MDSLTIRLRYWEIVYHLVCREGMRVVHFSKTGREVWLEDDRLEQDQLIRFVQRDFDWSNELRSDIKNTYEKGKQVRKQLKLRSANVVNLILSQFTPVDSYEELLDRPLPLTSGGKNHQRTILLDANHLQEKFFPLATEWKLNEMPAFLPLEQVDDEEGVIRTLRFSVQKASEEQVEKDRNLFLYGKPILTNIFLGIIIAIFLFVEMNGSSTSSETLIRFGAKFNPFILEGEWWRFFSAMFLHIGIFHLLMNSLALFYLGGAVERIYGSARFFFIYFLAGFVGSVASFAFNEHVSAGASGAIFGCFGALLFFGVKHPRLFFRTMGMNVIVILLINLVFGLTVPMVDNGAHMGGLVGGFLASAIVSLPKHKLGLQQVVFFFVAVAGVLGLLQYGYSQEETGQSYNVYFQLGYELIENDKEEEAREYFEKIITSSEQIDIEEDIVTNSYFLLGYTQHHVEEYDMAEQSYLTTIERDPEFSDAYYNLTLVYIQKDQFEDAYQYLQKAIELQPDHEKYMELEQELRNYID